MTQTGLLHMLIAVFAPAVAGAATLLLPRRDVAVRTVVTLTGLVAAFVALLVFHQQHAGLGPGTGFPLAPSLGLNVTFNADALGLFFGLLVSGIGA